jgi:uncharacterized hydrophobic protein (TIGR00271 family)
MKTVIRYFQIKIIRMFALIDGTDVDGTIKTIGDGSEMRGDKIWILFSGAILASIGLDTNSSAVIIGAMLISPLMNPILGIGLGIGISDRDLMLRAGKNFIFAVVASLLASTLYFLITPLGETTSELLARTKPTLLDVGVAIFGGIAGIVATSRKAQTNAIPGVAIATALMPPLCTAGFGIATWNFEFFWGAFYLFFINAVFISLSTYFIVRLLQFPYKQFLDSRVKRKMQTYIATTAIIVMIPSGIIFWNVIKEAKLKRDISTFVKNEINNEKYEAINWEIIPEDTNQVLKLFVIGEPVPDHELEKLNRKFHNKGYHQLNLRLVQMNVPQSERDQIKREVAGEVASNIMKQIQISENVESSKDRSIDSLNMIIETMKIDNVTAAGVRNEVSVLFPEISDIQFGMITENVADTLEKKIPIAVVDYAERTSEWKKNQIREKFYDYFKVRIESDSVIVLNFKG